MKAHVRDRVLHVLTLSAFSVAAASFFMHVYPARAESRPLSEKERTGVIRSLATILKDPDSARYQWPNKVHDSVYCGLVNAKNSYGGYTGFVPYVAFVNTDKGHLETAVLQRATTNEGDPMSMSVIKMCNDHGYFR